MSIHLFNMILNNNIYILYDFFACPWNMLKTRCIENLPTDKIFIQMVFCLLFTKSFFLSTFRSNFEHHVKPLMAIYLKILRPGTIFFVELFHENLVLYGL